MKRDRALRARAVVIGGGVIGLAVARQLRGDGWRVTVMERGEPGREASHAAAGMLAPHAEFHDNPRLLAIGREALRLYPDFVAALEAESGEAVDLRLDGILAPTASGAALLEGPAGGEWINGARLRDLEPSLREGLAGGFLFPRDGSVDNRGLIRALLSACARRGVEIVTGAPVDEVVLDQGTVRGVRAGARVVDADVVVNCAGAWAGQVQIPEKNLNVRPIKGQMLLLERRGRGPRSGPHRPLFTEAVYVVPRSDGRVVVGTTVEDKGFDKTVEAGALSTLLSEALKLVPGLCEARYCDAWAGLRPKRWGELPLVGPYGPPGFFVACGHFRNGILLAPLTALALADLVGRRNTQRASCFST